MVVSSIRSSRRASAGPSLCWCGQNWPKAALSEVSAGRGESSSPVAPVHPGDCCRIVRPREDVGSARIRRVSLGGLEQAELAGAGDRRATVLGAQFAVHGALVGFTVFSET